MKKATVGTITEVRTELYLTYVVTILYPTKADKDPMHNFPNKMKTPPRPSTKAY